MPGHVEKNIGLCRYSDQMANSIRTLVGVSDDSIPLPLLRPHQFRPNWLLTEYSLNQWIVIDVGDKPNITINFDVKLPNGRRLSNYPNLLDTIKRITYGVRCGPLNTIDGGVTQAHVARSLIALARWMLDNQIEQFSQLTKADFAEYSDLARFGIHAIVNTESVISLHISNLMADAGFLEGDVPAVRRQKALQVFPVSWNNSVPMLGREKLLNDAGLEGIGLNNADGTVSVLDDLEEMCSFYQPPTVTKRMQSVPSLDELDETPVSSQQLKGLLKPFEYLFKHRRYLDDCIKFNPFATETIGRVARSLGKSVGRTRTIPILQAVTLIERSIRWVLDYSKDILELKAVADAAFDSNPYSSGKVIEHVLADRVWSNDGPSNPFPILPGQRMMDGTDQRGPECLPISARGGMTLASAVAFLCTACATVIAAFSARRAAEVGGIKFGCIEFDGANHAWMRFFIYKTLQADSIIPIPEIVVAAVRVLETISERARTASQTTYLLQYNYPGSDIFVGVSEGKRPTFRFGNYLRNFGYYVDVPPLSNGTRWTFKPHQFRRFFAILYIWVYDLGDLAALSHHLRHSDLERTRRYTRDDELGHIIAAVDREHTVAIAVSTALGESNISGTGGERLMEVAKRLYARLGTKIQPVPLRKLHQRIQKFVERGELSLHGFPWGFCAIKNGIVPDVPPCSAVKGSPDFSNATASICGRCDCTLRTEAAIPYLENSIRLHSEIVDDSGSPTILRTASLKHVIELKEYLRSVSPNCKSTGIVNDN